jgi:hypothetical protein
LGFLTFEFCIVPSPNPWFALLCTEHVDSSSIASDLYLGGARLQSVHHLSCLRFIKVFYSSSKQLPDSTSELCHEHFLSHPLPFIIHL